MSKNLYMSKPNVVEALEWEGGAEKATEIINWILEHGATATYREAIPSVTVAAHGGLPEYTTKGEEEQIRILNIGAVEHNCTAMIVSPGDFEVKEVDDSFDVWNPDYLDDHWIQL
jgi:hypothetical protein